MNTALRKLRHEARNIHLTREEKNAIRARVFDLPVQATSPNTMRVVSSYNWFSIRFAVPTAALLVVVLGSGTVYASEAAVPGDVLYTIKVHVAEPVQGAFAVSDEAKAKFHTQLAVTRVEEAEALASRGGLSSTESDALVANFETHMAAADTLTQTLAQTNPAAAAEASAQFGSTLSAHSDILEALGSQSISTTTKENSTTLAYNIRSRTQRWGNTDTQLGATIATATAPRTMAAKMTSFSVEAENASSTPSAEGSTSSVQALSTVADMSADMQTASSSEQDSSADDEAAKNTAVQLQTKATQALSAVQKSVRSLKKDVDSATRTRLQKQIDVVADLVDAGKEAVGRSEYAEAKDNFTEALSHTVKLSAFISASNKFDNNLLRNLLRGIDDNEEEEQGDQ